MQLILLEKIRNLGELGDVVNVKAGYGRNFLLPHGKAVTATRENKEAFEARRAELERAQADALGQAQTRAQSLNGVVVSIARKAGEEGKLFGSVGTGDIAEAVTAAGHTLAKAEVHLPSGPLKELGNHEIAVSLHPEVQCKITVSVVAEA